MSVLDDARAGQNVLERIANAIPGFKGYRERELRRDADKLQREHLANQLDECKKALNEVAQAATRGAGLDLINDVEVARKRLDKVTARIRFADRGYAGFFDAIKVDEAMLEQVYQFDVGLLAQVAEIRAAASATSGAADVKAALATLITAIDTADARLAEREQILSGIR